MESKFLNKLTSLFYYVSLLTFIIAFNFAHNPPGGWYQQVLPKNLPRINQLTFKDSLTGYAVTASGTENKSYVIKTTNGGDNWNYILTDSSGRGFNDVEFLDVNTGFAGTDYFSGSSKLYKTTDGGVSWTTLNNPPTNPSHLDLSVLSENEIWTVDYIAFDGGVWRTTNGGISWQRKYYSLSYPVDRIHMVNSRIGFISDGNGTNSRLWKTTDEGSNWTLLSEYGFYELLFSDSLLGYKSDGNLKMTSDGGSTWKTILAIQSGNPPLVIRDYEIFKNTIWGVNPSGNILYPNNQIRGVIFRSTNLGVSWGYQLPDTSIRLSNYYFSKFSETKFGWGYSPIIGGVHTVTGGDTITYPLTSISNSSNNVPVVYKLYQNFPNPFNPKTSIEYEISLTAKIIIKVSDILGREIQTLVNTKQNPGRYRIEFDGTGLTSGIYFYSLFIDNSIAETKRMLLIK